MGAAPPNEPAETRSSRGRTAALWIALVLAGTLLVLSTYAVWINRVALNTAVVARASADLLADDAVRRAVATRAVDELFAAVDVEAELAARLPEGYDGLSGPAAAGLRQASYALLERALEEPRLQGIFEMAVRESHRTLVRALEGGGSRLSVEGGVVTLDLGALVREAAERIGLGSALAERIPDGAGRVVVLRSEELDAAQDAVRVLETLAWFLPLAALATFALAIGLARDRRRAVRGAGAVVVVAGAVGLVAANLVGGTLVESLVASADDREAARNAWEILSALLRGSLLLMIVVGVLLVVAAWLAGPSRLAVRARRALAPLLRERPWAYAMLGTVVLGLALASDIADFARLLVLCLLAVLGATWIEVTRRQVIAEAPDAPSLGAYLESGRERLGRWRTERRSGRLQRARGARDLASSLAALAELHRSGELSDEEYAAAKARLISGA